MSDADSIDLVGILRDNPGTLLIELDFNFFASTKIMRVRKPGKTTRSKPVDLLGVVVIGESYSELLRGLADALDQAKGCPPGCTFTAHGESAST